MIDIHVTIMLYTTHVTNKKFKKTNTRKRSKEEFDCCTFDGRRIGGIGADCRERKYVPCLLRQERYWNGYRETINSIIRMERACRLLEQPTNPNQAFLVGGTHG